MLAGGSWAPPDTTRRYQSEYVYNGSYCKNFMSDRELIHRPTAAVHPSVPQPSRAGPSTSTVMLISSKGVSYQKKPLQQLAATFTGQPSEPGTSTLREARSLATRLNVTPTSETLRSLELSWKENSSSVSEAPPAPISSPETVEIVLPASQKTLLMRVGLPQIGKTDKKGKGKAKMPPIEISVSDDEQVCWDTDDKIEARSRKRPGPYDFMDNYADHEPASLEGIKSATTENYDWTNDAYVHYSPDIEMNPPDKPDEDSIAPQVSSITFSLIGSLIIEQEQFRIKNGPLDSVDSSSCICNFIINNSLSADCSECKKGDTMQSTKDLLKKVLGDNSIEFIGDSGASTTFTYSLDDFIEYEELNTGLEARTANKSIPLKIKGKGTVLLHHKVKKGRTVVIRLNPVYYIPGLSM